MNKFIRIYNQNRKLIFEILVVIVAVIFFVQVFNNIAKINHQRETKYNVTNTSSNNNLLTENTTSKVYDKSAISGENVETKSGSVSAIKQFLDYCNQLDYKNSYDMLTIECKQEIYNTAELFKKNYIESIFSTKKTYSIQNWSGNTYLVRLNEDVMQTGKPSDGGIYQDYITVKIQDGNFKLNINNYIGKTSLKGKTSYKKIEINLVEKDTYIDYEIYKLKIKNSSSNIVLLDSLEKTKSIFIQDSNGVKYNSYTNELIRDILLIDKDRSRDLKIKFTNEYKFDRQMSKIIFSDVILDVEEYEKTQDKSKFTQRQTISIDIE